MIRNKMKGEFQFFNKRKDGTLEPLLDGAKSRNLIVDQFFECLGSGVNGGNNSRLNFSASTSAGASSVSRWFIVGTGSTPPAATDTALENQIASTDTVTDHSHSYSYDEQSDTLMFATVSTRSFPIGGVVGNISEVGVDFSSSFAPWAGRFLQSRALIRDSQGDPTTISLGAEDQLVVVYTLTRVCNRSFSGTVNGFGYEGKLVGYTSPGGNIGVGTLNGSGAPTSVFRVTNQDWTFPAFNGNTFPNTTNVSVSTRSVQNTNTKHSRLRWRLPLATGNFAAGLKGIYSLVVNVQIKFTAPIMKTNEDILDIELFTSFENMS